MLRSAKWSVPSLAALLCQTLSASDAIEGRVQNHEVWLTHDGRSVQLTDDGRTKARAELSSARDRVAYYEVCPESEACTPSVIILDLAGRRLQSFTPTIEGTFSQRPEPCASILSISWLSDSSIGVECHINPSLSAFMEIDLRTGKHLRDLAGFGFTPSPDRKWIAHVAPMMHFAPPYAKSYYLQLNQLTVYPLPGNAKPMRNPGFERPLDVVQKDGKIYRNIHGFGPRFAWSPDSRRVAFADCVFDWVITGGPDPGGNPIGAERNRKCSITVVAVSGLRTSIDLPKLPVEAIEDAQLSWLDATTLRIQTERGEYRRRIPEPAPENGVRIGVDGAGKNLH